MAWPWRVLQGMKNIKEASEAGVAEAGGTAMELVIRDASGTWKARGAEGGSPCRWHLVSRNLTSELHPDIPCHYEPIFVKVGG